jgi:hypothetical protein
VPLQIAAQVGTRHEDAGLTAGLINTSLTEDARQPVG